MQYLWSYSCKHFKKSVSVSVILSVRWEHLRNFHDFCCFSQNSQHCLLLTVWKASRLTKNCKKKNPFAEIFRFLDTFGVLHKEQNCRYFKYLLVEYGVSKWQQFVYNFVEALIQKLFWEFPVWFCFSIRLGKWLEDVKTKRLNIWWKWTESSISVWTDSKVEVICQESMSKS